MAPTISLIIASVATLMLMRHDQRFSPYPHALMLMPFAIGACAASCWLTIRAGGADTLMLAPIAFTLAFLTIGKTVTLMQDEGTGR